MRVAGPALAAALSAAPAAAVVGGVPDDGPLSRNSVMVLGSNGGVCSAVVVALDAVLTAAHCVAGEAEHRVHWREASGEPALVPPAATAIHPGYDPKAIAARRRSIDLALLRLASPVPARFEPATLSAAARLKGEPDAWRLRRRPRGPSALDGHLPHRFARGDRAFRREPHPGLGAGRARHRRLPRRFRRADCRGGRNLRRRDLVSRRGRQGLRRAFAGRARRPATGLDRPHARGLGAAGAVGAVVIPIERSGSAPFTDGPRP